MNLQERNKAIFNCHKLGLDQTMIGQIFDLTQSAVSKVISLMKSEKSPTKERTRGAKSKLSDRQKEELKEILQEPPSTYGYTIWDKWSIKDVIAKQFKVDYHENYIFQIMKCINFSSQKPQQKDYRQDPKKVREFKAKKIPAIKKSRVRK